MNVANLRHVTTYQSFIVSIRQGVKLSRSGVQGQSPGRGSGGRNPPEPEALLLYELNILTFFSNDYR